MRANVTVSVTGERRRPRYQRRAASLLPRHAHSHVRTHTCISFFSTDFRGPKGETARSLRKCRKTFNIYIWIPAGQPSRHAGSTPLKITQYRRDLYTGGVWVETVVSVDLVADTCPTNQLLYQTVHSGSFPASRK